MPNINTSGNPRLTPGAKLIASDGYLNTSSKAKIDNVFKVAIWGDSITDYVEEALQAALPGLAVFYGGVGGENSVQIKDRMVADTDKHNHTTVIWAGRNDYWDTTTVKSSIASMVAALGSNDRYIVLSITNGSGEPSGDGNYTTITTLNSDLAVLYGDKFLDVRATWVAAYDDQDAQDVIDYGNDVPPSSLRLDTKHPNEAGAVVLANAIAAKILAMDAVSSNEVLSLQDMQYFLENFPSVETMNIDEAGAIRFGGQNLVIGSAVKHNYFFCEAGNDSTTGTYNTGIGDYCLCSVTTGYSNFAIGKESLRSLTTGFRDLAIGSRALYALESGADNIGIGTDVGLALTSSNGETFIGSYSADSMTASGGGNVALGAYTLNTVTYADSVVAVGYGALRYTTSASGATAVGRDAGRVTGSRGVYLGRNAGYHETGSDALMIDNRQRSDESDARQKALLYGKFADSTDDQELTVNGGLIARPKSTVTPANNGEMTFELTSNTTLTVKVKGSDGTVRSAALTLS